MPRKPPKKSPKDCIGGGFMCARPATKKVRGEWYCDIHLPKKSPAKRMKPWTGWCDIDDKSGEPYRRVFPTSKACLDHRATKGWKLIQVLVTELPTPTDSHTGDEGRKLEAVRRLCVNQIYSRHVCPLDFSRKVLRILNTTPTAKGPR